MSDEDEELNRDLFRDCLFSMVIDKLGPSNSRRLQRASKKNRGLDAKTPSSNPHQTSSHLNISESSDQSDLIEFADYLSSEVFHSLPPDLRRLSYHFAQDSPSLSEKYSLPLSQSTVEDLIAYLPPSVSDNLLTYGIVIPPSSDLQSFISPLLAAYISATTTAPPKWIDTRKSACEICDRGWVPVTYHHLIPKQTHSKILKRGWHEERQLNSVAWLCRACHSFVHKMASNEELARDWYTVERICEREDVQKWAHWVQGVRWKKS